eukprot:1160476-Pelagomonas_calceolata.AAC.1
MKKGFLPGPAPGIMILISISYVITDLKQILVCELLMREDFKNIPLNVLFVLLRRGGVGTCVPDCNNLKVPSVLKERYFLVGAGLWIVVAKVGTSNGSNFTTEMWIGSDEFRIWGSVTQGLSHSITITNGMADRET